VRNVLAVVVVTAGLAVGLTFPHSAWSQSDNSVQSVIDALKPQPGKSRGSRPVVQPPAGDSTAAVAPAAAKATSTPTRTAASAARVKAPVTDDAPSLDFNVTFATGSADLAPSATKVLDNLGKALGSTELATSRFRIEGHTDTVGTPQGNRELSARRAAAVVAYLTQKYGISPDRLTSVGLGEESLVVPTGPQVSEQRNRRVRVVNISS
jgi:OmpA-OmpF porin, OOP family